MNQEIATKLSTALRRVEDQGMTRPTAWAHLPNAAHIDKVLASLKAHPEKWNAARDATWNATWNAAQTAARDAAWYAAWDAAWYAIAALIAYDDAGQFMKLPAEQLKAMHRLDPHPMYLLLQPAAVIFGKGTT